MFVIVPGRLTGRTGGYEYDRRIVNGLRERGWQVDVRELDDSFPRPTPAALDDTARVLAALPDNALVLIDGLAFGATPDEIERESSRLRLVALVHLPLAAAIGLSREDAARIEAGERRALAAAAFVVATGRPTVGALASYGVRRDRIALVEPGTDRAPLSRGSGGSTSGHELQFLTVAALTPGKGHEILIRALASVPCRSWRLTCAGSLHRHPPTLDRVRAQLRADGLEDRVSLVGELDREALAACYDGADVFVLATLSETYGMAVAEALARGLPVVSTATGAIPELIGDQAGLLVSPGDSHALAGALMLALTDRSVRERCAAGARRVRDRLSGWDEAVGKMASVLERVAIDE